jgi:hypothetical protein
MAENRDSGTTPKPPAPRPYRFVYRNYRGEIGVRAVLPISVRFGSTEWHPEPQWLLLADDTEKGAAREFAMRDMRPMIIPTGAEVGILADIGAADPIERQAERIAALEAELHTEKSFAGWLNHECGKLKTRAKTAEATVARQAERIAALEAERDQARQAIEQTGRDRDEAWQRAVDGWQARAETAAATVARQAERIAALEATVEQARLWFQVDADGYILRGNSARAHRAQCRADYCDKAGLRRTAAAQNPAQSDPA